MDRTRRAARLDDLSSEELEEIAFGPDPTRRRRTRRGGQKRTVGRQGAERPRGRRDHGRGRDRGRRETSRGASRERVYCYACGESIDARAEICPDCGVRQRHNRRGDKSRAAAALLALLLGTFGVHKFYLGKSGLGLLYALFFWTGIPALAGFIEFILFVLMSDGEFDEKYN